MEHLKKHIKLGDPRRESVSVKFCKQMHRHTFLIHRGKKVCCAFQCNAEWVITLHTVNKFLSQVPEYFCCGAFLPLV